MNIEEIISIIQNGENTRVEFKRCGNGFEKDLYETICSFSNRFGGDIFCGVLDDGTIKGLSEKAIPEMIKNFLNVISNPELFNPIIYILPEIIKIKDKTIIQIHVPVSAEIHSYKNAIYDRLGDADIKIKSTSKIAELAIRKQNIFTEQKIYPFANIEDLNETLIDKCRILAINKNPQHPWKEMTNIELIQSANLIKTNFETGQKGLNLAGILLLGKDDVISSVLPQYKTDAIVRKINLDRYDDRKIIKTNLINSFDILMEFIQKNLWDKFYIENNQNISIRDKIAREVISNILMHREFTSTYVSKLIIENDKLRLENPCKAINRFELKPETFEPVSKNPIIASFFNNIGFADELGSGIRNLYKYTKLYSGKYPTLIEDDIFKTTIPLVESFSADYNFSKIAEKQNLSELKTKIIECIKENPNITQIEIANKLNYSRSAIQKNLKELQSQNIVKHSGSTKSGIWIIN